MKRILITGANRGFGLELTRQYLDRGDLVFATARQPDAATELRQLTGQYPDRLHLIALDLTDEASITEATQAVQAQTDTLDVLLNNAGVYPEGNPDKVDRQRLGQLGSEDALYALRSNAIGPLLVTQALLPLLRASQQGRIVSLSSGLGSLTWKAAGTPYHYSASKAALNMYMRSLAAEVGHQGLISVVVDPGWIRTGMGGESASLAPADSARGILKLTDQLHAEDNGCFLTWQGQPVPW